jgi:hypothetical protein
MRNFGTVFLLAMSMLGSVGIADAVKAQGSFEIDVDRNGSNYKSPFAVSTPEECRQLCAGEEQCVAWTHVRAGIQGAQARCWLKNATPEPTAHSCCVSGVKLVAGQQKPPKDLLEKYQMMGKFAADCTKPPSPDNPYFVHRPIDASTVQLDQMSGSNRDSLMIIDRAWEVRPNEIFMSGDNEGQPVELSWIMRNQRQLVLEMTIGGKKIISGGNRLSTKAGVPLISKCGD